MGNLDRLEHMMEFDGPRQIPPGLFAAIGAPLTRKRPSMQLFGGNDFWKRAAGIQPRPASETSHLVSQDFQKPTQPPQPSAEIQGEQ
ncbi:hypothetical protein H7Y63_02125 [Polaromonas sp.]|nr:hypothetical protein [Candidatus Saccharibacteria bacterium]